MTTYTRYVDYDNGNDTTGDGSTGTPWKTLVKAAATPPGGLVATDTVDILVRNGDGGTPTDQRPVFSDTTWAGVHISISPDTGEPNWAATTPSGASEYIIRFLMGTVTPVVPASLTVSSFNWTITEGNQQAIQCLQDPSGGMDTVFDVSDGTAIWGAWNTANILISASSPEHSGTVTIDNVTTSGMAKVFLFDGMSGTVTLTNNTFGLGAGSGTWRVLDFAGAANRKAPNIFCSDNVWTGDTADGQTFLVGGYTPIIETSDKLWSFTNDTFDLDGAATASKFINCDDVDATSTHRLRFKFVNTTLSMNSSGTMISIGQNVGGAYTNAQKPRLKTLTDDATQLFAKFEALDSTWTNIGSGGGSNVCAIKIGVIQTVFRRCTLTAPNGTGHSMNFIANDCTLDDCYLEGELPLLAYGDRITVQDCYSKGNRPFVAGKTGGGQDEASQGHTIIDNIFECTGSSADDSAFDSYGWQADDPYGGTWYSSTDTDGSEIGLKGWVVQRNRFITTNATASPVGLGRTSGAGSHELGRVSTNTDLVDFLADGNGGEGPWIDTLSVFSDNFRVASTANVRPIVSSIIGVK